MQPLETGLMGWALARPGAEATWALADAVPATGWRSTAYLAAKRAIDILLAAPLLVLMSPVMLVVAAAIKVTSPGPVLFRQPRAGRHGRPFIMYKFRSMVVGAEDDRMPLAEFNEMNGGPCFKLREDPRLTRIGRFLRRTSLDELPQLINVLKGEMTLVGPRPLPLPEVCTQTVPERRRLQVTPGLTCLWQISGRCEIPYYEWMLLDLFYVRHRSLMLDAEILIKTLPAVLSRRGAF